MTSQPDGTRSRLFTLVSFHAHPDDEALLTAGTLARAAAEGHRVVLVVATRGEAGLTAEQLRAGLGERRLAELRRSAAALGVAEIRELGYADSGMDGRAEGELPAFARAPVEQAAARLAVILRDERADVLTVYDPAGGYGHPDHVQVHRVGVAAAAAAGTPLVLEATVNRRLLQRALRLVRIAARVSRPWGSGRLPQGFDAAAVSHQFSDPRRLTHAVGVRRHLDQKRAAMAAHATQALADGADRTLAYALRLPRPLFALAFGREWFVERGRPPGRHLQDDIFASLR